MPNTYIVFLRIAHFLPMLLYAVLRGQQVKLYGILKFIKWIPNDTITRLKSYALDYYDDDWLNNHSKTSQSLPRRS